jgi:nucleoside-diphosphate-sugar epimerase
VSAGPRTVLVTGGAGFVGSHLVDLLVARGDRVRVLVRPTTDRRFLEGTGVAYVEGDVGAEGPSAEAALARAAEECDIVYHVAGVVRAPSRKVYERVNAEGTRRMAIAAARAGVPRILLVSSQAAAGPTPTERPLDESDPERPVTTYGESKLAGERAAAEVTAGTRTDLVVIRPPAVYGPRDRAFLMLFRSVARGFLPLHSGAKRQLFSLVHVRDLVRGMALAADAAPSGRVYFLTDGVEHAPLEVAREIAAAVGRDPIRLMIPQAVVLGIAWAAEGLEKLTGRATLLSRERVAQWTAPRWTISDARARREIGYDSTCDVTWGMKETATWYRQVGWI